MPQFFLPRPDGTPAPPDVAEETYDGIKKFARETTGWEPTERRIFRVVYRHDGADHEVEVGDSDNRIGEVCVAILETPECFLVCTANRGVVRGSPMLVGIPHTVVDFDA